MGEIWGIKQENSYLEFLGVELSKYSINKKIKSVLIKEVTLMNQNKVIVITGATRGVWRNIARFFAEKGSHPFEKQNDPRHTVLILPTMY
jgi:hypothetical protein